MIVLVTCIGYSAQFTVELTQTLILICNETRNLSCIILITDVEKRDIGSIGLIAGLPNLCSLIGSPVAAFINDFLRTRHILPVQKVSGLWAQDLACVAHYFQRRQGHNIGKIPKGVN